MIRQHLSSLRSLTKINLIRGTLSRLRWKIQSNPAIILSRGTSELTLNLNHLHQQENSKNYIVHPRFAMSEPGAHVDA